MHFQTVTTIVTAEDQMETQLAAATQVARGMDAHLQVMALAIAMDQLAVVQSGFDALPLGMNFEECAQRAEAIGKAATEQLLKEDIRWNVEPFATTASMSGSDIMRHLRFSDLVVLQHEDGHGAPLRTKELAEYVLFDADCPLLLLPTSDPAKQPADNIMVSWDESPAALRAARLALPLMRQARVVHIVLVDPPKDAPERSDPGGAFAQFLARHGVNCEVSVCSRTDNTIAATLERRAEELGCDLLVMGAYGHSRLRQAIFGGTTRAILEHAGIPVLMAH